MPRFIFIQQISVLNTLNMVYNLHFFSSKCRLFHNATLFGFCITNILNTGVLKFEEKKFVPKRLKIKRVKMSLNIQMATQSNMPKDLDVLQYVAIFKCAVKSSTI